MNKRHASVIALLLGLAVLLGTFATMRTTHLGAASRSATDARIAAQTQRLSAAERSLRRALAARPARPATPRASQAPQASQAPKTVYVRPAPIVVHLRHHGDDGRQEEGSFDD